MDPTNYILHSNLSASYCQLNKYTEALRFVCLIIICFELVVELIYFVELAKQI
jgi:hypothetical protein